MAEFPNESVERQVQAAALRIAVTCAEDLARAGDAVPREARTPKDAPIAQAFFDLMQVTEPGQLTTAFGTAAGTFDLIEDLTHRVEAARGLLS
jgi:hypothetical protein